MTEQWEELKETIKNNQLHIEELTDKYQSLFNSELNVNPLGT